MTIMKMLENKSSKHNITLFLINLNICSFVSKMDELELAFQANKLNPEIYN